jgi:tetratricopeptide (TPR) repeat protein
MIFQASIRNMDSIIRYFENSESENERVQIKNINKDRIVNYGNMAKKHVTFKRNGKKLKNIFNHIFGFPLFPDEEIESIILDLVLIRNIILHEGGWPQPYHAELIRNNGVIIVEQKIGVHKFYKLEIVMNLFMKKAIDAIRLTIKYIHNNIENDSRFDVDSDNVYFVLGEYDKAVEDFEKRIKFYECNLGDEHPKAKKARENLEIAKDLAKKNIK